MPDSRSMTRSPDPREPVADIGATLAQRLGSRLGTQGAMNMGYNHAPAYPQGYATDPIVPSVPEQIGVDRREWATWSPAVRQAILAGKLPDLSPEGLAKVAENFATCAPDRGFGPPPGTPGYPGGPPPVPGNPGAPGGPPPVPGNPGIQGGPPPTAQTVGIQGGPAPTSQTVGVEPQVPPQTAQAFVAPGGQVYVQAFAPGGAPLGFYPLPQQGIVPAGQAASGPSYPPLLGWIVLGGALLAVAWMMYEITRMKSEMKHGSR